MSMRNFTPDRYFSLKQPCDNCPFRVSGAINLEPGRLKGIVDDLLRNDHQVFDCHKTVHCEKGGEWDEETGEYTRSGNELHCAGATILLLKQSSPSIPMRIAMALGHLDSDEILSKHGAEVIESVKSQRRSKVSP